MGILLGNAFWQGYGAAFAPCEKVQAVSSRRQKGMLANIPDPTADLYRSSLPGTISLASPHSGFP